MTLRRKNIILDTDYQLTDVIIDKDTMNIYELNEKLLKEWESASINNNEQKEFVPDGILYRGEIIYSDLGFWSRKHGNEGELWQHSPKRILFITKDLNDDEAWDIRSETCRKNHSGENNLRTASRFCKNYLYQIYGLGHTTSEKIINYNDISDKEAIEYFDVSTIARINVKKQLGDSSIKANVLREYIDKYADLVKQQILLLDADIIVSCGSVIFHFIKENCYNLEKINDWIYYCCDLNKIIVNSWHPAYYGVSTKDFYNGMIEAYYEFLQSHTNFINPHR